MEPEFQVGDYVRLVMAPATRMGTIEATQVRRDRVEYHFKLDPRLAEPGPPFEVWLPDVELERCQRPTDQQAATIMHLLKYGR
jgi:hypothetical protein